MSKAHGIGRRVAQARRSLGLTQAVLAERISVPRSTLAEIETGKRGISAPELYRLSEALLRPLAYFFGAVSPRTGFALRAKAPDMDEETTRALVRFDEQMTRLQQLAGFCELSLRTHGVAYSLEKWRNPRAAARAMARAERQRLGLGVAPVSHLRELLEERIGLPAFGVYVPHGRFCGAFAASGDLVCLSVNVAFGAGRKNYTLAHEFAHYLTGRHQDHVSLRGDERTDEEERFAEAFAEYFLLPLEGLQTAMEDFDVDAESVSVDEAILLASHFAVSYEALLRTLSRYGIIEPGARDELLHTGRPQLRAREMGVSDGREEFDLFPATYRRLAFVAHQRGKITRARLAEFLEVSASEADEQYADWLTGVSAQEATTSGGEACA